MALKKKDIEIISVSAVKNSVVVCEFLEPIINERDKDPSWDGEILIYKNKTKKKEYLKGRMPIQVKGTECENHSKREISFLMSTVDLRNYLYDGGCVLFVVYIGNGGLTNKIYYVELTPIKLRQILEEAKGQRSKTVYLKEFPSDNNKKATIFLNCLQNCQKQASFTEGKLLSLEELQKLGKVENIFIPVAGVGIKDTEMALFDNELYLYAKIKDSSIPQPIKMLPKDIQTETDVAAKITIDDRLFYTEYKVIKKANTVTLLFGHSFKVEFNKENQRCNINYKNSDNIRDLAKDLDFILTYIDKGYFKINDEVVPFDYDEADFSKFKTKRQIDILTAAQNIVKVLDMLGCDEDINRKDIDDEGWRNINRLITAFIYKKPIDGLKENLSPLSSIKVGNLRIAICLKKCEKPGEYEVYDFFKTELSVAFEDESGKMIPISQYSILKANDFLTISNMNFDVLLPSFQKSELHKETYARANLFLLELLNAYDDAVDETKKKKILNVCEGFSDWLFDIDEEYLDYPTRLLNRLQTIKRRRSLNIEEVSALYELIENKVTYEEAVIGAYLILDNQQAAEIHLSRLTKERQDAFKEFPIYRFYKETTEETNNDQT